ncbi:hypothetical protein PC116_g33653 [Phytophthora cactorum]|nr:hypothetical protein PC116_g33653 [Phytophthora cactorum]
MTMAIRTVQTKLSKRPAGSRSGVDELTSPIRELRAVGWFQAGAWRFNGRRFL